MDCARYKTLGEVCVIEHGKNFLWEFCRDFQPEVKLPDYNELMRTVKKEIALERKKAKEKKKRERAVRRREKENALKAKKAKRSVLKAKSLKEHSRSGARNNARSGPAAISKEKNSRKGRARRDSISDIDAIAGESHADKVQAPSKRSRGRSTGSRRPEHLKDTLAKLANRSTVEGQPRKIGRALRQIKKFGTRELEKGGLTRSDPLTVQSQAKTPSTASSANAIA